MFFNIEAQLFAENAGSLIYSLPERFDSDRVSQFFNYMQETDKSVCIAQHNHNHNTLPLLLHNNQSYNKVITTAYNTETPAPKNQKLHRQNHSATNPARHKPSTPQIQR